MTPAQIIASYSDKTLTGICSTIQAPDRRDSQFLSDRQQLARNEIRRRILREEANQQETP